MATVAPPAPPRRRAAGDLSGCFAGIAALDAAFVGVLTYGRNPDPLATASAVGVTFLGALIALHVLRLVFHAGMAFARIAVPLAIVLMVGCALDWAWAESVVDCLREVFGWVREWAARGWAAWQTR